MSSRLPGHVVAQVVEADFVVGDVGDVALVGGAALRRLEVVLDHADGQAEKLVERPHPLGVALGQVVVDGDEVDAFAQQRVRVNSEGRDERLAFAGLHLGDFALVEHLAAHDLDVEVAHPERALPRLAADRERLGQHVVERLALRQALLELDRLRAQLFVGQRGHRRFEGVGRNHRFAQLRDFALVAVEEGL